MPEVFISVMKKSAWLAAALSLTAPQALAQGDIVWPTYSQVSHTTDLALSCEQLDAEIDHVSSDIRLLAKARDQVQDALRTGFDLDRYRSSRQQGTHVFNGNGGGEERFSTARDEITASRSVAMARRTYLTNLLAICKKAPGEP